MVMNQVKRLVYFRHLETGVGGKLALFSVK
jgi:hypothetical protein